MNRNMPYKAKLSDLEVGDEVVYSPLADNPRWEKVERIERGDIYITNVPSTHFNSNTGYGWEIGGYTGENIYAPNAEQRHGDFKTGITYARAMWEIAEFGLGRARDMMFARISMLHRSADT